MSNNTFIKKIFIALVALIFIVIISGIVFKFTELRQEAFTIHYAEAETIHTERINTFVVITKGQFENDYVSQTILYDPDTFVMYTYASVGTYIGGITPVYNSDGTLKLYKTTED